MILALDETGFVPTGVGTIRPPGRETTFIVFRSASVWSATANPSRPNRYAIALASFTELARARTWVQAV
jgi:hypothetical protein